MPKAQCLSYPYARGSKPTTENWCPMWGLWLVVGTPEGHQHPAAAACWLAGDQPQSHMKIISFLQDNSSKHDFSAVANSQLWAVCNAITQVQIH